MSKVKNNPSTLRKEKLIHSLRRYETRKIKRKRYNHAKNYHYRFCVGYCTHDFKYVSEKNYVLIPSKTVQRPIYETTTRTFEHSDGSVTKVPCKTFVGYENIVIPEHIEIRKRAWIEKPLDKPYTKRINTNLKAIRKIAARKFRRTTKELYEHGDYKKNFNVWDAYV